MKKLFIIFGVVLIGVYILLSLLDTSDYTAERKFWVVNNQYKKLVSNPDAVPDYQFEQIILRYTKIIQSYPKAKLTPWIYLQIGNVYLMRKDFAKARERYLKAIDNYPENQELHAEALAATAQTYERENNGAEALRIYEKIQKEYPLTITGFNMPLYIASYYQRKAELPQAKKALDRAISYYKNISSQYPNSPLEFNAWKLLATCYFQRENWQEGVETLGKLLNKIGRAHV